uniref:Bromo domain-containing protein n=1 Tax=Knipowitschia caucasica TaxID=637954 RepID=A0AAV2IYZ4_KNICA
MHSCFSRLSHNMRSRRQLQPNVDANLPLKDRTDRRCLNMEHTAVTEASSEVQGPALDPNPKQSHVETPLCAHESEFSDLLSPTEVCISSNTKLLKEEKNYEVQQAFRIFTDFLTEKHKHITSPFLRPAVDKDEEPRHGHAKVSPSICLRRMEEKFVHQEYRSITEFVADFRSMLENCYRRHGVDHWLSKQAQRLEVLLEQKLTLLSRKLREKTTLAVTSKGRFSVGEEPASSTRRRQTRHVQTLTAGGHETAMVQRLRLEEQLRTREEKRQRELEKKEAEEMSAKEMDDWEQSLLSQASPHSVESLWELPAIGHFLCLAQTALNLPEIVFFELERCLLMPRCSTLLSKTMSALLCPPQRRSTLHRRPALPYRRWEFELRQRVLVWYRSVGSSRDQAAHAEQLGLCHRFFSVLGRSSPLEAAPFHLLPFYQRVWLLKGLCDHVYETQREVQKAVLAQPIHEWGANISLNEGETKAKQRRSQPRDQSTTEKRKSREGIDLTPSKKIKNERHSEPYFKLICTNLDDLRDLINKTENELDDLQRRKKKLNPWYLKKEAVRELHSTLIRLLNELTPWEPKLIKAYQRNRLRIKKEFEVFKSHPEYLNFVREESVSSSEEEEEQGSVICRDPETIALPLQFGGTVPDLSTRTDCQKPALTATTSDNHRSFNFLHYWQKPNQLSLYFRFYIFRNFSRSCPVFMPDHCPSTQHTTSQTP